MIDLRLNSKRNTGQRKGQSAFYVKFSRNIQMKRSKLFKTMILIFILHTFSSQICHLDFLFGLVTVHIWPFTEDLVESGMLFRSDR